VERRYGFEFADDHRAFLAAGLPVHPPEMAGRGFPDWRDGDPRALLSQLACPVEGMLFDVEHNSLRPEEWGNRPSNMVEALGLAGHRLDSVPRMIPVCGHRYLPAGRGGRGHPVLSMWQTDIICYGCDLYDYIEQEFVSPRPPRRSYTEPTLPFWSNFVG